MPWRFKQQQAVQVKSNFKVNSGNMAKAAALKGLGYAICSAQLNQDTFLKELCSYSTGDRSPLAV